jgi:hypothetical protein
MDIHIHMHIIIKHNSICISVYIKLLFWGINMFYILADIFDMFISKAFLWKLFLKFYVFS